MWAGSLRLDHIIPTTEAAEFSPAYAEATAVKLGEKARQVSSGALEGGLVQRGLRKIRGICFVKPWSCTFLEGSESSICGGILGMMRRE